MSCCLQDQEERKGLENRKGTKSREAMRDRPANWGIWSSPAGDRTLIGGVRRAMAQVGKARAVVDDSGEAGHLFFGQGNPIVFSVSH